MTKNEERDLFVAVNAGIVQDIIPNDGYISQVNPDGTATDTHQACSPLGTAFPVSAVPAHRSDANLGHAAEPE